MTTQNSARAEIGLCILLSVVDGDISEEELAALTDRVGELLGDDFDPTLLPEMLEGELASIEKDGVDDYVAKLPDRIPAARRYEALRGACAVACADGLAPEEEDVVRQVAVTLGIDADDIIASTGARHDTEYAQGEPHDDEPNADTKLVGDRLRASGWVDPMQSLRDAGIHVGGVGAMALQYECPNGHLLRLEHHTCDGSLHLHVTDESDTGADFVLYPDGRESELTSALVALQNDVTLDNIEAQVGKLTEVARVCLVQGGMYMEIGRAL